MKNDAYLLFAKAIAGEDLSDDENKYLREYNIRYTLVRFLVMEKLNVNKPTTKDFQFTPGDEFMTMPIIDIVNSLVEIYDNLKYAEPLDFGDSSFVISNPPVTGRTKTTL